MREIESVPDLRADLTRDAKSFVLGLRIIVLSALMRRAPDQQVMAWLGFASPELLWRVLTAKRWELLKAMCGAGAISIREAARRVDRDVKAVHGDVKALLDAGLIGRTPTGAIDFPVESVKVEFGESGVGETVVSAPTGTAHPF